MIWTIIGKARDSQGGGKNQTNKQSIFNELQVHSTALWLSFSCMALDSRPASLLQMESHQKDWFFVPHRKVKKTSLNNYILGKIKKKKKGGRSSSVPEQHWPWCESRCLFKVRPREAQNPGRKWLFFSVQDTEWIRYKKGREYTWSLQDKGLVSVNIYSLDDGDEIIPNVHSALSLLYTHSQRCCLRYFSLQWWY